MKNPETMPTNETYIIYEVAKSVEAIAEEGFTMRPDGRQREAAWAKNFYGNLRDEIASRMIDEESLAQISRRSQSVTVGELANNMSSVVVRYSKSNSPDPVSQRGVAITWGYEPLENNRTKFFQTLIQVGSRTEDWQEIPIVNMPQIVAEYKTTEIVADNDQEVGLQREIPGWVKIAGGVGATAVTAAALAIGAKFVHGKLKKK